MSKEINWEVDRKFRESIERGIERVRQLNKKVSEGFEKSVRRQKVREEVKPCPICQIGGDAMNEHKCNSCSKEFATCDCSRILWGRDKNPQATGAEADKVLACDAYEPKALRAENEELLQGYFKGNSVNHWYTKAKCYGDMVHGAAIPLEKSGHPICSDGPDGAVGGVRRAIEALVSDRDAFRAENEQIKQDNEIQRSALALASRHAADNDIGKVQEILCRTSAQERVISEIDRLRAEIEQQAESIRNITADHDRFARAAVEWMTAYKRVKAGTAALRALAAAASAIVDRCGPWADGQKPQKDTEAHCYHGCENLDLCVALAHLREVEAGGKCECGADRKECENNRRVNRVHLNHVDGE